VRVHRIARDEGPIYLRFGGIVTDESWHELDASLLSPDEYDQHVLVSLRDVTLLNSSGIGMLLKINRAMQTQGGMMILLDVPTAVRHVFDFMKLDKVLKIAENEQQAHEMLP
jgi:anti-anti-sigma factor